MKVFSATDIGQKRTMNQDFVFASASPVGNLPNLFVVADGMGGHNAGDFASRYGVSVLVESVKRDTNFNPVRIIRHGIEAANSQIFEQAKRDISMEGMGTTMVVGSTRTKTLLPEHEAHRIPKRLISLTFSLKRAINW